MSSEQGVVVVGGGQARLALPGDIAGGIAEKSRRGDSNP